MLKCNKFNFRRGSGKSWPQALTRAGPRPPPAKSGTDQTNLTKYGGMFNETTLPPSCCLHSETWSKQQVDVFHRQCLHSSHDYHRIGYDTSPRFCDFPSSLLYSVVFAWLQDQLQINYCNECWTRQSINQSMTIYFPSKYNNITM